ncbi:MAG: TatD family hydrolase [Candidatus Omnitrophica bacterium]|nr:TatD family hydrolase [Candidatus Omnitrophota bacterium]
MLVDTHCHLHFDAFDADRDAVIDRARAAGVKGLINVGTDPQNNEAAWKLASQHSFMRFTAGLHPHSAHEIGDEDWKTLERFVKEKKPSAIGEIGLDYFKSEAAPAVQKKVFERMLGIAMDAELPVIVHSRNAFEDTFEMLARHKGRLKGVMHCFSYDETALFKLLDLGFHASFTGNITFKNAGALLEVATQIPLDRIMLETDSPYLAPQPHRGKRNEPAHLVDVARFLAQSRKISVEELENTTTQTAAHFFGLKELK